MRIALTGATGFIGRHLLAALGSAGHDAVPLSRADLPAPQEKLAGATALIHLAGIAHARGTDHATYDAVNRDLPVAVARAARAAGVGRFVFVSSSNAETAPGTPYGASKAATERGLLTLDGIEVVIVRPTPVYGPGARGNFATLQRLAASRWPLPFGNSHNRRSIVSVSNLADALIFAATGPGLSPQTFTATDGPPLTLAEIVTALRAGMNRSPRLFPGLADLVFAESVVDGSSLNAAGWTPPQTSSEALQALGRALGVRAAR
jgi:UDP-glucose 4-epimerase